MTPEELKISIIKKLIYREIDDESDELLEPIWKYTYWDKKYQNVDKTKQPKIIEYVSVLARDFPKIEDKNGDIYILSTGLYRGFTSKEKLGIEPSYGEVVSIPGGGSANVKYWKGPFVTADNRIATSRDTNVLDNKYFFYFLQCNIKKIDSFYRGTSLKHPDMSEILEIKIPLRSVTEQKEIVSKIEELLPLIDRYEKAWTKIESFNKKFPIDMENSLLQLAMMGKLVNQDPLEGTGKDLLSAFEEKKKKKVLPFTDDDFPFEIPQSWEWVHLNEISDSMLGKTINKSLDTGIETKYLCSINVYWEGIDLSTVKSTKFSDDEKEKYLLRRNDLLICEGGDVGRSALWESDEEMYYQNALHRVRFYKNIVPRFYLYVMRLYKANHLIKKHAKGETIKHLVQGELNSMPFPLPPYNEQKRIVAKLEEILPLCRKLVK